MAEYTNAAAQTVAVGGSVVFTETPVACNRGYVQHRAGSGVFTLRGCTNQCSARYKVSFGGNLAVPADGKAGPVSVSLAISGEALGSATAIVTPAAVSQFFNVFTAVFVDVPRGCCINIGVKNNGDVPVDVQNANLIVERVA